MQNTVGCVHYPLNIDIFALFKGRGSFVRFRQWQILKKLTSFYNLWLGFKIYPPTLVGLYKSTIADKAFVEENKLDNLLRMQKVLSVFLIKILTNMSISPVRENTLLTSCFLHPNNLSPH